MKNVIVTVVVLAMTATAFGAAGDWWILPIDRTDGNLTTHVGAGYNGTDAKEGNGPDGVRRVWWNTNNVYQSSGGSYPAGPELFTVESWGATAGAQDWQPIEVVYNGYAGDDFPIEANIPWAGAFGQNHQWLGSGGTPGAWKMHGPGPQGVDSTDFNSNPNGGGTYMWMTGGSVLYAKWDFGFPINRSWSMIRVSQITPEPASLMLLLLGAPLLRRKGR